MNAISCPGDWPAPALASYPIPACPTRRQIMDRHTAACIAGAIHRGWRGLAERHLLALIMIAIAACIAAGIADDMRPRRPTTSPPVATRTSRKGREE